MCHQLYARKVIAEANWSITNPYLNYCLSNIKKSNIFKKEYRRRRKIEKLKNNCQKCVKILLYQYSFIKSIYQTIL